MVSIQSADIVRFGIITDIHFSLESNVATASELRSCLDFWRHHNADFLLQLGDLIKGSEEHKELELQQAVAILKEFPGIIRHVLGNHCPISPQTAIIL